MRKIDINEVKEFIEAQSPDTKIYIGADSARFLIDGDWYADYTLAIVVHINGKNGCKIFGEVQTEIALSIAWAALTCVEPNVWHINLL